MVVVAIIGLLAALAVPTYAKARANAQRKACIANLHEIDGAKELWAIEYRKAQGSVVRQKDILPYLRGQRMPVCPAKGFYSIRVLGRDPTCTRARLGHVLRNPKP